jgi:hypothetical protein
MIRTQQFLVALVPVVLLKARTGGAALMSQDHWLIADNDPKLLRWRLKALAFFVQVDLMEMADPDTDAEMLASITGYDGVLTHGAAAAVGERHRGIYLLPICAHLSMPCITCSRSCGSLRPQLLCAAHVCAQCSPTSITHSAQTATLWCMTGHVLDSSSSEHE